MGKQQEGGPKHPPKSHIANVLGGHGLDEQSGRHLVLGEGVKSARGETATLGRGDHTRNMFGTSPFTQPIANKLLHSKNSRNNAIVLQPLRAVASHELLHELLQRQTTIPATP